jgi:hypothetical protein
MPLVGRNRFRRIHVPSQYVFVVPCMENNNHLAVRACTSFLRAAMAMTVAVARRWRDTAAFPPLNGDFVVTEAIVRPGRDTSTFLSQVAGTRNTSTFRSAG